VREQLTYPLTPASLFLFKASIVLEVLAFLFLWLAMPESVSQEAKNKAIKAFSERIPETKTWKQRLAVPFEALEVLRSAEHGRGRFNMLILGLINFLDGINQGMTWAKTEYLVISLGWTQQQFGPFMSFISAINAVVLVGLVPRE
jgi:hypothetical protein